MDGKSVRLRVYIGRRQPKFFMPGRIGEIDVVRTPEEAAAKWSKIEWRPDSLHWASTATARAIHTRHWPILQ